MKYHLNEVPWEGGAWSALMIIWTVPSTGLKSQCDYDVKHSPFRSGAFWRNRSVRGLLMVTYQGPVLKTAYGEKSSHKNLDSEAINYAKIPVPSDTASQP
eukprot:Filipodium_phascolosomae@DN3205_c0_g1_i1.p1